MSAKGEYISDFDESAKICNPVNPDGPIDFSVATKLEGNTGSTCDIYVTQYHQTKVLIKRLKPKLKDKVLYRNALEKEFMLGFRLKHNGLPTYREFHGDYIIIEFVDGDTLASLIKRRDTWLTKEKNIHKFLMQLIEVIKYLHAKGISHCDVKADNIILTRGHYNVVLIDLDKTYTAYNPNSAGTTSHFDLEVSKVGHPDMDFHGVGKLVDRILRTFPGLPVKKFRKFEAKCMRNNVQSDDLMDWLQQSYSPNNKHRRNKKGRNNVFIGFGTIIFCIVILAVVGLVLDSRDRESKKETTPIINSVPQEEPQSLPTEPEASTFQQKRTKPLNEDEDINDWEKEVYKKEIESQMTSRILPIISVIEEGKLVLANPNSTDDELRGVISKLVTAESKIAQTAYSHFENQYPSVEPMDIQLAVINSNTYKKVSKEAGELIQKITDEIVSRNPNSYSQVQ